MSYYYLIDFENVREYGISSLPSTESTDHIYVFYTDNAAKLNMDAMLNHEAELKFIKVAAGKQSLDMHLVSVMGFLLRDQGQEHTYVVVSRDGGFDNVISFWKSKGFSVMREPANIPVSEEIQTEKQEVSKKNAKSKRAAKSSSSKKNNRKKEKAVAEELSAAVEERTEEAVMIAEEAAEEQTAEVILEEEIVNEEPVKEEEVAEEMPEMLSSEEEVPAEETVEQETVTEQEVTEEEAAAETVPAETESEKAVSEEVVPEKNVSEEKEEKKETPEKEDAPEPEAKQEKEEDPHTLMNKKLMNLLRTKLDANTLGAIASLVIRNMDVKNYKQVTYRAMVKKFGQKKGLEYYNMIKKEI